jgi:hypothetical protein
MKNQQVINKVQFQNQLVNAMLETDKRLSFKHFNNRRYYFNLDSGNDTCVLVELRVHLNRKCIAVTVRSTSTLNEITQKKSNELLQHMYFLDRFLDRRSYANFSFNPYYEALIKEVAHKIHSRLIPTFEDHMNEILISRRGIELGMDYDIKEKGIPFVFPSIHYFQGFKDVKNQDFKDFYVYLFKVLKMADSQIPDHRIKYVLLSIIQVVLEKKKIPFTNPLY